MTRFAPNNAVAKPMSRVQSDDRRHAGDERERQGFGNHGERYRQSAQYLRQRARAVKGARLRRVPARARPRPASSPLTDPSARTTPRHREPRRETSRVSTPSRVVLDARRLRSRAPERPEITVRLARLVRRARRLVRRARATRTSTTSPPTSPSLVPRASPACRPRETRVFLSRLRARRESGEYINPRERPDATRSRRRARDETVRKKSLHDSRRRARRRDARRRDDRRFRGIS